MHDGRSCKETQSMLPMVKVSTLFHRVDGFDVQNTSFACPDMLDTDLGDQFLEELLAPIAFDPGEDLVQAVLEKC